MAVLFSIANSRLFLPIKIINMRKIIISAAFAVIISLGFIACNNSSTKTDETNTSLDTTKLKTGETFYQCEMHPEVLSDKPGSCPKCGMDLKKIEKK
jgi:Cu(I)/Ag(I) efflux system membrane fusion protein